MTRRILLILLLLAGCRRHRGSHQPDAGAIGGMPTPSSVKEKVDKQVEQDQKRLDDMAEHPIKDE